MRTVRTTQPPVLEVNVYLGFALMDEGVKYVFAVHPKSTSQIRNLQPPSMIRMASEKSPLPF
jgi:hypothetical protein